MNLLTKGVLRRLSCVLALVGLALSTSLTAGAAQAGTTSLKDAETSVTSPQQKYSFLTQDIFEAKQNGSFSSYLKEYESDSRRLRDRLGKYGTNSKNREPISAQRSRIGYWTIKTSTHDYQGRYVPTRWGDNSLGYTKMVNKHNLYDVDLINAVIAGRGDLIDVSGDRYTYRGHIVGSGVHVAIRVVTDRGYCTRMGCTPDNAVVGSITGYCEGYTRCPDFVNHVVN